MRPEKIILHIDFNSFFASVEQQANPFLRGQAIAVAGKGFGKAVERSVITTASREAKLRGIKTAMSTWEARKIIPNLLILPGDPQKYSEITARMLAILRSYADAVEQFSTDEAFADITCASGGDYLGATFLGEKIRRDLKRECGAACTASIGIAGNRLLAKLASESHKPNGFTVVPPEDALDFAASRPLAEFCGIGPRVEKHLERIGVTSIINLRTLPLERLLQEFKSYGQFLFDAARGQGSDIVLNDELDPKSVGHSYTFPFSLRTKEEVQKNLLAIADRVAWRMRKHGFVSTHLTVYARYDDFSGVGASRMHRTPLYDGLDMTKNALALFEPLLDLNRGIRLMGISTSGLVRLAGAAPVLENESRKQKVLLSLDKITEKYGNGTWQRVSTMDTKFKERVSGWHYDHEV